MNPNPNSHSRHNQVAKNASAAAEGLCTWVQAMKFYHEASKIVKPKLEALAIAEGQMDAANKVNTILLLTLLREEAMGRGRHFEACSDIFRDTGRGSNWKL